MNEPRFAIIDHLDRIFWDSDSIEECFRIFTVWGGETFFRGIYDYEQSKYLDLADILVLMGPQISTLEDTQ